MARITALVLAAGTSSRMGDKNKLLLTFKDQTMVSHVVDQLIESKADNIVVVTGNDYDKVEKSITQKVEFTHNPDYNQGLSSSLKTGIAALPTSSDAVMICLGDMPYISSENYNKLLTAFEPGKIIAPTSHGKIGNPLIFARRFFPDFDALEGDKGARKLLKKCPEDVITVDLDSDAIFEDIDTPSSYQDILAKI